MDLLTERQLIILALQSIGLTNKEIAGKLSWSQPTVNNDMFYAREKANCRTQLELMYWFACAFDSHARQHYIERSGLCLD